MFIAFEWCVLRVFFVFSGYLFVFLFLFLQLSCFYLHLCLFELAVKLQYSQ